MEPRVEIASGRIEGSREDGVLVFRGIPYARPPQGALRLRAPLPPEPWAGVREAKTFRRRRRPRRPGASPRCSASPTETFAEDCLYLNVWTPGADARVAGRCWSGSTAAPSPPARDRSPSTTARASPGAATSWW